MLGARIACVKVGAAPDRVRQLTQTSGIFGKAKGALHLWWVLVFP
jgi:hypothetical protein